MADEILNQEEVETAAAESLDNESTEEGTESEPEPSQDDPGSPSSEEGKSEEAANRGSAAQVRANVRGAITLINIAANEVKGALGPSYNADNLRASERNALTEAMLKLFTAMGIEE